MSGSRLVEPAAMIRPRRWLTLVLIVWLAPALSSDPEVDVRAVLDQARELSYSVHWQQAQASLDCIADRVDPSELREYADFQLLEARHLALADRSAEALARVAGLLVLDLADDQRLRALQFNANLSVLLRQYERAFEYLEEALAIPVGPAELAPRIATLNMASYMLGRVGEFEHGLAYGEEAVALSRQDRLSGLANHSWFFEQ